MSSIACLKAALLATTVLVIAQLAIWAGLDDAGIWRVTAFLFVNIWAINFIEKRESK